MDWAKGGLIILTGTVYCFKFLGLNLLLYHSLEQIGSGYCNEKVFASSPENYTEVTFKSRGKLEAGCFRSKGDWSTYIKLEPFDGDSYIFLKKEDFPALLSLLEKGQGMMKYPCFLFSLFDHDPSRDGGQLEFQELIGRY